MSDAEVGRDGRTAGAAPRRFHIVLHRPFDLEGIGREAVAGKRPRLGFIQLAERLKAAVHVPGSHPVSWLDRLRARFYARPEVWAMARAVRDQTGPDDVIYCVGEEIALPIALVSGGGRKRARLAMFAHNVVGRRVRTILRVFRIRDRVDLVVTNIRSQVAFLRDYAKFPDRQLYLIQDQTDMKFFTPGPASPNKTRPVIASVGLEQRDYRTLAAATGDLDVDVRISGFSTDAAVQSQALPETLPSNMSQRFYEWTELVQLYRDADVVVVSLFPCRYSAGITTVMEGTSCRRPVVATRTAGLADYLEPDAVLSCEPGDPAALRGLIEKLLADPVEAEALADRGHAMAKRRLDSDRFTEELATQLEAIPRG